ncbi:3358_t:CDS:2 [Ambispora leptoticha]|uniref:3358_t:CDS:1 n=1 Tax=Ambispora leptoticha TaxID=144679 RepID=A0A9N8YQR8_9GLOM|nr:3358_t:CDS:2 [Ambispora leptoticha]
MANGCSLSQKAAAIIKTLSNQNNLASKNAFTSSWLEWTAKVLHQKPELPEVPPDALKYQQYIINPHGWWPIFGGEPRRKRKTSPSFPSFRIPSSSKQNNLIPSQFPKRRKIHNSAHFSSPFSCKNYLAIEWLSDQSFPYIATPPRTTTSALPQENFAAVTSRVLLVRRLKAKQGNFLRGDAASRFRKNILLKVAQALNGDQSPLPIIEPRIAIDSPGDIIIKRPWKDGTTEPSTGTFKELQKLRGYRNPEMEWSSQSDSTKLQKAREELSNTIKQGI